MRYTLDIVVEIDGVRVQQHLTQLTEAGMHQHVNELLLEPVEIVSCLVSESQPFEQGRTSA
jgi:hypothetical protein